MLKYERMQRYAERDKQEQLDLKKLDTSCNDQQDIMSTYGNKILNVLWDGIEDIQYSQVEIPVTYLVPAARDILPRIAASIFLSAYYNHRIKSTWLSNDINNWHVSSLSPEDMTLFIQTTQRLFVARYFGLLKS